jgi:hypothetical protein
MKVIKFRLIFVSFLLIHTIEGTSQVDDNIISVSNSKSNFGITLGALNLKQSFTLNENIYKGNGSGILIGLNYFNDLNKNWGVSLENNLQLAELKNSYKLNNINYTFQQNYSKFNLLLKFQYNLMKEKIKIAPDFINFGPVFSYQFLNNNIRSYSSSVIWVRLYNYNNNKINYNFVIGTGYKFDYKYGFVKALIDFPLLNFLNNKSYYVITRDGSFSSSSNYVLNNIKENSVEVKFIFGSNAKKIIYREKPISKFFKKVFKKKS